MPAEIQWKLIAISFYFYREISNYLYINHSHLENSTHSLSVASLSVFSATMHYSNVFDGLFLYIPKVQIPAHVDLEMQIGLGLNDIYLIFS